MLPSIVNTSNLLSAINLSAGLTSAALSAFTFNNANGVSFGLTNSIVTASHNALTTARASNDAIGLNTALTAGPLAWTANSAGLSLNAGSVAGTGFTSTTTAGTAIVGTNNSAGLSIGVPTIVTNALTTARASNDAVGLNTAASNVTWTVNSNGISLNANGYAGTSLGFTGQNVFGTWDYNTAGLAVSLTAHPPMSAGMSTNGNTSGDTGLASQRLVLVGGNNITLSGSTNGGSMSLTISGANVGGAQTGISSVALSDTTYTSGQISFRDGNGVSWASTTGQGIILTHGLQFTSATSAITSNALHSSASRVINVVAATNNAGGGTASLSSNVSLSAANGATFYTSAGGAVALSYTVPSVTEYFSRTSTTFNGTNVSGSLTINTNGLRVDLSVAAAGGAQTGISSVIVSDATYTSGMISFSNQANVTIGSSVDGATQYIRLSGNAAQTNQSAIRGLGVSNTGATAGNTGISTGIDWVLAGSQSITLSQSTAGGGPNTIWMQHPAWLTTAMQSNAATLSNIRVSGGTTSNLLSAITFADGNGISFGLNASTMTASHNALTSQSNQNVTAANGGFAFQTLSFSNVNGISFGTSAGSAITASHNAITTGRASNDAIGLNTAQTNVTWTVNSSGLSINAAGYAGTATTFNGANISASITLNSAGLNLSASVAAPGAAAENNWVHALGANTAGNTTVSGSTLGFSGVNLTLSGTNNSQLVFSVPATSSLQATGGLSISTNGSTISLGVSQNVSAYAVSNTILSSSGTVDFRSFSFAGAGVASVGVSNGSVVVNVPAGAGIANSRFVNENAVTTTGLAANRSSVSVVPFVLQNYLDFSNVRMAISLSGSTSGNNSTNGAAISVSGVLYSLNASSLSSINSGSNTFSGTWSSNATASLFGPRALTFNVASTTRLNPGEYWWAIHVSSATTAHNTSGTTAGTHAFTMAIGAPNFTQMLGADPWAAATVATRGVSIGLGIFSTGATVQSIAISDIQQTGSRAQAAKLWLDMRNYSVW